MSLFMQSFLSLCLSLPEHAHHSLRSECYALYQQLSTWVIISYAELNSQVVRKTLFLEASLIFGEYLSLKQHISHLHKVRDAAGCHWNYMSYSPFW